MVCRRVDSIYIPHSRYRRYNKGGIGGVHACKRVFFPKILLLLYKQHPASALWLSCIREKRKFGLIYFPQETKRSAAMLREQREQKTRRPCGHIAVLLNVFVIQLLRGRKALRAHGKKRSAGGEKMKRGERGRDAESQISINSMWSLQPHCGNFYCGPQIRRKGFNLQCHLRLRLYSCCVSVCL